MTDAEATGRPIDEARRDVIDELLSREFEDFSRPNRSGENRWRGSWSGKNTFELASTTEIRRRQYQQLYPSWSEQIHAAPGALLDGIARSGDSDWIKRIIADDRPRSLTRRLWQYPSS